MFCYYLQFFIYRSDIWVILSPVQGKRVEICFWKLFFAGAENHGHEWKWVVFEKTWNLSAKILRQRGALDCCQRHSRECSAINRNPRAQQLDTCNSPDGNDIAFASKKPFFAGSELSGFCFQSARRTTHCGLEEFSCCSCKDWFLCQVRHFSTLIPQNETEWKRKTFQKQK